MIGTDAVVDLQAGEADLANRYARTAPAGLVARERRSGSLVKACDLSLSGVGFPVAHVERHPRRRLIEIFARWAHDAARQ